MGEASVSPEMSPSQFIDKVSLVTGKVVDAEIPPEDLLVRTHRDYHLADIQARRFMSRMLRETGDERRVLRKMGEIRRLGQRTSEKVARILGREDPAKVAEVLFGIREHGYFYRFKKPGTSKEEIAAKVGVLRRQAAAQLDAARRDGRPAYTVLLTGGTGFVGKELLWQAADDEDVAEVVVLIRPKKVRDPRTGTKRLRTPAERGADLLRELRLADHPARGKFRFIAGDVEQPGLGIAGDEAAELRRTVTHVVHGAASVAFDDPYERSFRANVIGTRHALAFSHALQSTPGSPFVAHVSIETSYIHGRQVRRLAREEEIVFPRHFYNNYYELTKAMASLETERFMLAEGLRLLQLCPAIVIGESRTGNNRGDTKVVNAPVNLFGRVHQALTDSDGGWVERSKAAVLGRMACVFPGDPSAELNLIPVDRVVHGILAALRKPQAVGQRIHLAADHRVTAEDMRRILLEEVGVEVTLAEPTLHRNFTQPAIGKVLGGLKQQRFARTLEKLVTIFGNYSEWGQPIHAVGRDVEVLGLAPERPDARDAFRMLCRHNRYVLEFGKVRDLHEVARRETVWRELVLELEAGGNAAVGSMPAETFHQAVREKLDLAAFERRAAP